MATNDTTLTATYLEKPAMPLLYAGDSAWTDGNLIFRFNGNGESVEEVLFDVGYGCYYMRRVE